MRGRLVAWKRDGVVRRVSPSLAALRDVLCEMRPSLPHIGRDTLHCPRVLLE